MKVLLVTRELNGVMGGLERQILMISDGLAKLGLQVCVVSLEKTAGEPFFEVNEELVNFESIIAGDPKQEASLRIRLERQVKLFRIINRYKPDIIITFMIGSFIFTKPISTILRIPTVLSERNSPDIYRLTSAKKFRWIYFLLISTAKRVTVQFPSYAKKYPRLLQKKIIPIPNQVPDACVLGDRPQNSEVVFGFAGRFSFQKRIDVLIRSFSVFNQDFPNTKLILFGYGEQREYLESIIAELNLNDKVAIRAEHKNITEVFRQIDIFCLFSLWEGFPNVLAEALAHGIPAIGFTTCDGVDDLIQDGVNGWKLPYEDSLQSGYTLLCRAYEGFKLKEVSRKSCIESVSQYSSEKIYVLWRDSLKVALGE